MSICNGLELSIHIKMTNGCKKNNNCTFADWLMDKVHAHKPLDFTSNRLFISSY